MVRQDLGRVTDTAANDLTEVFCTCLGRRSSSFSYGLSGASFYEGSLFPSIWQRCLQTVTLALIGSFLLFYDGWRLSATVSRMSLILSIPQQDERGARFLGGYHVVPCTLRFICNIDTLTTQCDLCVWAYFDVTLWWDPFFLSTPGELLFRGHCFLDSLSMDQESWRDMVPGENGRSSHRNHNHRPANKCSGVALLSERILNHRLYWNVSWWRTHVLSTRRLISCFFFLFPVGCTCLNKEIKTQKAIRTSDRETTRRRTHVLN